MKALYEIEVVLTARAPLLSGGGGDGVRGLNKLFVRRSDGGIALNSSHIKGKLKEAVCELGPHLALSKENIIELFGAEESDDERADNQKRKTEIDYRSKSALRFSDFIITNPTARTAGSLNRNRLTKVRIDSTTGTSKEQALQMVENLFDVGKEVTLQGRISFFADEEQAALTAGMLTKGLRWITALGSSKGSGFGRLERVKTRLVKNEALGLTPPPDSGRKFCLHFEFEDDLLIGGIKKATYFTESQNTIPGGAIKGSLSRFLNRLCGNPQDWTAIDASNTAVAESYRHLAQHFSAIRCSHAFPVAIDAEHRPVTIPFSAVKLKREVCVHDVALLDDQAFIEHPGKPAFQINWKSSGDAQRLFGWRFPEIANKTRTAIHPTAKRAKDEHLYTFQYLTPYEPGEGAQQGCRKKIKWISTITFPKLDSVEEQQELTRDFLGAIAEGWQYLGKRDARFNLSINKPPASAHHEYFAPHSPKDGSNLAVVALQTDALLFDGKRLAETQGAYPNLEEAYQQYWGEATGGSCRLVRFFARQKFAGGFQAKNNFMLYDHYYPFVLTEAGSVFVLELIDPEKANPELQRFSREGLPLPTEVSGQLPDDKPWYKCPFVPQNGYGEIRLNLAWHWLKQLEH